MLVAVGFIMEKDIVIVNHKYLQSMLLGCSLLQPNNKRLQNMYIRETIFFKTKTEHEQKSDLTQDYKCTDP